MLINQTNKTECKNRTAVKTAKSSVSKRLLAMQKKPSCSACTYLYEYRWASSALGLQGECNCDFRNRKEQLDGICSCALKTSLPNMDKYSWYEQMLPWQFFRKMQTSRKVKISNANHSLGLVLWNKSNISRKYVPYLASPTPNIISHDYWLQEADDESTLCFFIDYEPT